MKKLLLSLFVLMSLVGLTGIASANCGNDNGNGNGCSGDQGPQGQPGTNGANGANGVNGANGMNAQAPTRRAAMIGGLELRLFDTRWVSMAAFDDFQFDSTKGADIIGEGSRNNAYGARLTFKLGRDYTEDRIDALEKKIKHLEALSR